MKKIFALLFFVGCGIALAKADPQAAHKSGKENSMISAVIHVNFSDSERQGHGLKNVVNILKEVPSAKVEVVCHGAGIGLLVQGDTKHADKVQELIGNGVSFVACENTLKDKSIPKDKLLAGVTTVPAGAVEIISKQREGYSYFKP